MLSINPKLLYVRNQKTGKFVPLVAIIGPKGPPGSIDNITDYLTNEKGDSEELAMSQKGVTAEIQKLLDFLDIPYVDGTPGLQYYIEGDKCLIMGIGDATNRTDIIIPSRIKNIPVTIISDFAFENCTFSSITIPNSVTSIGMDTFAYCHNITRVTIPNSVTIIKDSAFSHCSNLKSITIGNGVTVIDSNVFSGCDSLTDIYYQGTEAEWANITIDESNKNDISAATIHFASSLSEN